MIKLEKNKREKLIEIHDSFGWGKKINSWDFLEYRLFCLLFNKEISKKHYDRYYSKRWSFGLMYNGYILKGVDVRDKKNNKHYELYL